VITGASSGIGLELARQLAEEGYDLVIAAEDGELDDATAELRSTGASVEAVLGDLGTGEGVDALATRILDLGRPPDALVVNAGIGVNGAFVDTDLEAQLQVVELNVAGAVRLTGLVLPSMVGRGAGRVMFTSSIAATMAGPYMATYNASKAFLYSFSQSLRQELEDAGITVTALMPGPTDTEFFERAGMEDTMLGQTKRDDAAKVARQGIKGMLAGKDHVVTGLRNKAQVVAAKILPDRATAAAHGKLSEPGSGKDPESGAGGAARADARSAGSGDGQRAAMADDTSSDTDLHVEGGDAVVPDAEDAATKDELVPDAPPAEAPAIGDPDKKAAVAAPVPAHGEMASKEQMREAVLAAEEAGGGTDIGGIPTGEADTGRPGEGGTGEGGNRATEGDPEVTAAAMRRARGQGDGGS
jgi:short-subunit dehydrogenase